MEYHPKLRPVDSPTDGVFLAGAAQGPKDIPASVAQGSAAASRAARVLSADTWEIEPIVARVWPERCISAQGKKCGICATACPYGAITVVQGQAAAWSPRPSATAAAAAWPSARTTPSRRITLPTPQVVAQLQRAAARQARGKDPGLYVPLVQLWRRGQRRHQPLSSIRPPRAACA